MNPHPVRSADGTTIAYEESGTGPRLVLVHGSLADRSSWAPIVPALQEQFTVVAVDVLAELRSIPGGVAAEGRLRPYGSA